ncbi:MAG: ATP-dependent DNA helicase [Methanomicrobiales archaeon]|jgi:helicase|nr:ATP-dependent DNA helicase [Methanomicrobiales archaeon]
MHISDLPIPKQLKDAYLEKGITALYPPQAECIERGLLDGENMLISIPTASGKTILAEMAIHKAVERVGRCIYIVPLRALASEKYEEFSNKGITVGIATGDLDRQDAYLGSYDLIVATSEKTDSLIRNRTPWIHTVSLIVIDEIHLIASEHRGVTLEMVIAKLHHVNPSIQIIGLSATIGNPKVLAGWMNASLVTSSWRPVDLRQGVYFNGVIQFGEREGTSTIPNRVVPQKTRHDDLNLCFDTIEEGGQCLLFVSSRRNAEGFAKRAAKALACKTPESVALAKQLLKSRQTGDERTDTENIRNASKTSKKRKIDPDVLAFKDNVLASCVAEGVAFHHAGLKREERSLIEEGFRKGYISVIAATPTLAAGLNLPARRVIIRDYMRFAGGAGMVPIPVMEFHQMAGRAGRPHLDPYGEAVLIAKDQQMIPELIDYFIDAAPEHVTSQCTDEESMASHILSLITSDFAPTTESLTKFMEKTFYAYQHPKSRTMGNVVSEVIEALEQIGMIVIDGEFGKEQLRPTSLGMLTAQLYIDPMSARIIIDSLTGVKKVTPISLFHLIGCTSDMQTLYLKSKDHQILDVYIYQHKEEFLCSMPSDEEGEEIWLRALKTALVLNEWIDEVFEDRIEERFGVGAGDIYNVVESAKWLLYASSRLSSMVIPAAYNAISTVMLRTQHGVKSELLPLVKLRDIGRVRARRMYNAGMRDDASILAAGHSQLARIIGATLAERVILEVAKRSNVDIIPEEYKENGLPYKESGDKNYLSRITDLPGIGPKRAEILQASGYATVENIMQATPDEISRIIGATAAKKIFSSFTNDIDQDQKKTPETHQSSLF